MAERNRVRQEEKQIFLLCSSFADFPPSLLVPQLGGLSLLNGFLFDYTKEEAIPKFKGIKNI